MDEVTRRGAIQLASVAGVVATVGAAAGQEKKDDPKMAAWDFTLRAETADAGLARLKAFGPPRPDQNGICMTQVPWGTGPVFLIDRGVKRGFTNVNTFINLYGTGPHKTSGKPGYVIEYADIGIIPDGGPFQADAVLVSAPAYPVFLIDDNHKRGISSAELFEKTYLFSWGAIKMVPPALIRGYPDGPLLAPRG